MAKRKAAAARKRKTAAKRPGGNRARTAARKTLRRSAGRGVRKAAPKAAGKKKTAPARKAPRRAVARKAAARKTVAARKAVRKVARKAASKAVARKVARPVAPRPAPRPTRTQAKVPALNRVRRTVQDEDIVQSPPSSLDLDRTASAARSGKREMQEHRNELTQTGPALTGGDLDADWESAYSVGDEAPGGDNPTPDQDVVDEIGEALGLQYEDNEELKTETKITKRDSHRWELDPASSDDYNDR